jgi:hypothetical protein
VIETELNVYLLANTAVAALVGTKIYPVQAPKDCVAPFIVFNKVSAQREYTHNGFASLQRSRMQVSCYAARYLTNGTEIGARSMAEAVKTALEAWQGSTKIQAIQIENDPDLIDPDTNWYHVPVDFFVVYGG